ncbi:Uncharacterised protein [Neisseria meningitidis]|nr:Uncharacterised protein [Neisseria meningitidis]
MMRLFLILLANVADGIFCAYLKSFSTLMKICMFLRV